MDMHDKPAVDLRASFFFGDSERGFIFFLYVSLSCYVYFSTTPYWKGLWNRYVKMNGSTLRIALWNVRKKSDLPPYSPPFLKRKSPRTPAEKNVKSGVAWACYSTLCQRMND